MRTFIWVCTFVCTVPILKSPWRLGYRLTTCRSTMYKIIACGIMAYETKMIAYGISSLWIRGPHNQAQQS